VLKGRREDDDSDLYYRSAYFQLASPMSLADVRSRWPDAEVVLPQRYVLLDLEYCLRTKPKFLLTAPEGAAGFTVADIVACAARAYQWCYEREDMSRAGEGGRHPFLLNRGPSYGPFHIAMHDLGDLILHSFTLCYSTPPAAGGDGGGGAGAAGGGGSDDIAAIVLSLGIDS
jgi:hypothetical protein